MALLRDSARQLSNTAKTNAQWSAITQDGFYTFCQQLWLRLVDLELMLLSNVRNFCVNMKPGI